MGEDLNGVRIRMDRLTVPELIQLCELLDKRAEGAEERVRAQLAELIRDELVCCNIYARLDLLTEGGKSSPEWRELRRSHVYHDICYFGEWAARIVENGSRDEVREGQRWSVDSPVGVPVREGAVHEVVGVGGGEGADAAG